MVDPKVEAPLRKMLGHIMRGETDDALELAEEIGPQTYESAVALAIAASGYIAIDTASRWPNQADIKALAKHAATTRGSQVTESEISDYLSRVVLGSDNPLDVFQGNRAAIIPLFATANLLVSYSGLYADQWEYLDAIWNAIDEADQLQPAVLPAATFRLGRK
ncbi:MAG: hypothetical protein J2P25_03875 [Nocardiopsaceae bacterium]|nr:hypothetical protein [Nocardiopsaceae bacterium]